MGRRIDGGRSIMGNSDEGARTYKIDLSKKVIISCEQQANIATIVMLIWLINVPQWCNKIEIAWKILDIFC